MSGPHPGRLLGKVVVTGAALGQGAAEAESLTREGAHVAAEYGSIAGRGGPPYRSRRVGMMPARRLRPSAPGCSGRRAAASVRRPAWS
ncbi:hypothetical protein CJD44_26940 [Streptomyces sp. alain-838]|nr:hypothetical protein CJD44_26940 [Streptomyces sp. alain-838]